MSGAPKAKKIVSQSLASTPYSRAFELVNERGASNWLTTLPLEEHGFSLSKEAFRDALCLKNTRLLIEIPSNCVSVKRISVEPCLSCRTGCFPVIKHNEKKEKNSRNVD